jgi:hypothetical protein
MMVLLIAVLVLVVVSRVVANKEVAGLLKWISLAMIAGLFIFRLFKGKFGSKPTRGEIEERVFENK